MILADVNVLLSAFRPDAEHHGLARRWLDGVVNADASYGVSPQVLSSVLRLATFRRVFRTPSAPSEVFAFCSQLLEQPNAHVIVPGPRHWSIFEKLCIEANARAHLVPNAWFAALAIEHGCEWITLDRDFARFPGLTWSVPKLA